MTCDQAKQHLERETTHSDGTRDKRHTQQDSINYDICDGTMNCATVQKYIPALNDDETNACEPTAPPATDAGCNVINDATKIVEKCDDTYDRSDSRTRAQQCNAAYAHKVEDSTCIGGPLNLRTYVKCKYTTNCVPDMNTELRCSVPASDPVQCDSSTP